MPNVYPEFEDANKTRKLVTKTADNPGSGTWYCLLKLTFGKSGLKYQKYNRNCKMPTKPEIGNRKGSISPEVVRAIDYLYIDVLKTRPKMPRIKPKSGDAHIRDACKKKNRSYFVFSRQGVGVRAAKIELSRKSRKWAIVLLFQGKNRSFLGFSRQRGGGGAAFFDCLVETKYERFLFCKHS